MSYEVLHRPAPQRCRRRPFRTAETLDRLLYGAELAQRNVTHVHISSLPIATWKNQVKTPVTGVTLISCSRVRSQLWPVLRDCERPGHHRRAVDAADHPGAADRVEVL